MTKWMPSLNALRAFEATARHLSYPSAAAELGVTPAAVKQLVSKLEDAIGLPLVERRGRGLALTRAGQSGCADLVSAMRHLSLSVEKMRGQDNDPSLIVTVEASLATTWLVPKLEGFRARHPRVNVLIDSSQEIVDLGRRKVDVAIRYGVTPQKGQVVHRLFDDRIFPACSPALAAGPPVLRTLEDLSSVPLIHWDIAHLSWASQTRKWFAWESWFAKVDGPAIEGGGGVYFNDYGQAVQAAIAGQGVMLASWPILRDALDAGVLVRPFHETVTTDIGYDLVTTGDASQRPEVSAFVAWMLSVAQQEREAGETSLQSAF